MFLKCNLFSADSKANALTHQYQTSHQKQVHTSCLSWQKPYWQRLGEIAVHRCSLRRQLRRTTMVLTVHSTFVPSRSDCMLLVFTTASAPTGSVAHTPHMCPGSLVRTVSWFIYWRFQLLRIYSTRWQDLLMMIWIGCWGKYSETFTVISVRTTKR
jgi:hypothetical protein